MSEHEHSQFSAQSEFILLNKALNEEETNMATGGGIPIKVPLKIPALTKRKTNVPKPTWGPPPKPGPRPAKPDAQFSLGPQK
jgi:hypothetical protein